MSAECYPITVLPHVSKLYQAYLSLNEGEAVGPLAGWYGAAPMGLGWMRGAVSAGDAGELANELAAQAKKRDAGAAVRANIEKLRGGARAVVTGQQVGLLGGPLLTLLKAATAVAKAAEATRVTGVEHVPVFWCATEDHDLAEVDQVTFPGKASVEMLRLGLKGATGEVGAVPLARVLPEWSIGRRS